MKDDVSVLKRELEDLEKRVLKLESLNAPVSDDELLESVIETIKDLETISTSFIQRRFSVGYARAAHMLDCLEDKGLISKTNGTKPREVLVNKTSKD